MLGINTTIDVKYLEIKLKEILYFDITKYTIINIDLLSVNIRTRFLNGNEHLEVLSIYEILLERQGKQEYYNVEIINYYSINNKTLNTCLKDSIRIY